MRRVYGSRPSKPGLDSKAACVRCGLEQSYNRRSWKDGKCPSCNAKPVKQYVSYVVNGHKELCLPWKGKYDELDRPVKDGKLYRPGERICGHSDCVSGTHVIPVSAELEMAA